MYTNIHFSEEPIWRKNYLLAVLVYDEDREFQDKEQGCVDQAKLLSRLGALLAARVSVGPSLQGSN